MLEQTSLTGGSVSVDVAEKTTLTGALIASTTGDLTLTTGSLDYSDIHDRTSSTNVGGGAGITLSTGKDDCTHAAGSANSASFGFNDTRKTDFATIGAGTITVRDGGADLSQLNRDTTIAQYGTMDAGAQLSADKGVPNPLETYTSTVAAAGKIGASTRKTPIYNHS